jgi:hypothetical protein
MASNLYFGSEFYKLSFGDKGLRLLNASSTSVTDEHFAAIFALEDAVITTTCNTTGGDASLTSLSLSAGFVIYGNFDDITVTSGKIIGYLR